MTVDQIPANRSNRVTAIYRDSLCKYLYYIHIYSPLTLRDLALLRFVRERKSFSRTCSRVRIAVNRGKPAVGLTRLCVKHKQQGADCAWHYRCLGGNQWSEPLFGSSKTRAGHSRGCRSAERKHNETDWREVCDHPRRAQTLHGSVKQAHRLLYDCRQTQKLRPSRWLRHSGIGVGIPTGRAPRSRRRCVRTRQINPLRAGPQPAPTRRPPETTPAAANQ